VSMLTKILAGGAGLAAIAAAAPAAAQYGYPPYGYAYGYNNYAQNVSQLAVQRCAAVVQSRLQNRSGVSGILGSVLGVQAAPGRVVAVTRVDPRGSTVRVRGLATSGRPNYGPYGVGAYGAVGYGYQPDLSFKCDVDYRGYVRDVDIARRR